MSFQQYLKYKDSGVEWLGSIPDHWDVVRAAHLFREVAEPGTEDLPILSVSIHDGVSDDELSAEELDRKVTRSDDRSKYKRVEPDDLVYNMMRAWQGGFGTVRVTGMVSPAYVVARPKSQFSTLFVEYLLRTPQAVEEMRRHSYGVTDFRLRLYWDQFKDLCLTLPPFNEQAAIVTFIDREVGKIDALVEEQRRLIELLKEKRRAAISDAVTKGIDPTAPMKDIGVEWLDEVPTHWRLYRIKYLKRSIEQGWSPQCESSPVDSDDEWGVLKVGCVNGGVFRRNENKKLPIDLEPIPELGIGAGDLLVSRANTRELVGQAAVVPEAHPKLLLCDKLYRLRLELRLCIPEFLAHYLGTAGVRGQIELAATGASSSMLNIGQSTILEMPVALPALEEQRAIIQFLGQEIAEIDLLTKNAATAIALLQERRASLISAAVTGKINVCAGAQNQPREAAE